MKKYFLLFISFLSAVSLMAQITVEGTVYSKESNETLPGVTVLVVGTSNGTVTDLDGKYKITTDPNATLKFSYVGYKSIEVPVNNRTKIDVSMATDTENLDEVVVVGYGIQKKSDVTGALVSLSGEQMQETHQQNIASILQGRAAGVTVTSTNG